MSFLYRLRDVVRRSFHGRASRGVVVSPSAPVDLSEALRSCPGMWVALRHGKMVEVQATPYALVEALRQREIKDATIIRAPDVNEPELVGLG